jgi:2-dehydropantoate 2-reductase
MGMRNETIYIVGAGAIGKVLAVFLKLQQKEVVLIRGSVDDQPSEIQSLRVQMADASFHASVEVNTLANIEALTGIVVLTNKSFGNEALACALKPKLNGSPIVVMQNGLNIEQSFIDAGFTDIYRCVLFATSQPVSDQALRFQPVTTSPIGVINGTIQNLEHIVAELNSPNFPFKAEMDIQPLIWKKTISNSVFNSVCSLIEIDNGIFHRNEKALTISKRIIKECVAIAKLSGVILNEEDVVENLLKISKASDGQQISTLVDIKNKRRTEIDTFNFAIASIAEKYNQESLAIETKLLGELTKLKSELTQP